MIVAHSWGSLGMMLRRPKLPEVAETQYRPRNRCFPRRPSKYVCRSASRTDGSVEISSKWSIRLALVNTGSPRDCEEQREGLVEARPVTAGPAIRDKVPELQVGVPVDYCSSSTEWRR